MTFSPLFLLMLWIATSIASCHQETTASLIDLTNCFNNKNCLTKPDNCLNNNSCALAVTWAVSPDDDDFIRIEMSAIRFDSQRRKIEYIAFALSGEKKHFMENSSVIVCGLSKDGSKVYAYLAHNNLQFSYPLPSYHSKIGLTLVNSQVTATRFACVIDKKIKPTRDQIGLIFPLDQFWHPALAVGPNEENGSLRQHFMIQTYHNCLINLTATKDGLPAECQEGSKFDRRLATKLHGAYMMVGWMVCIGSGLFTPRYLRPHWSSIKVVGVQLWFIAHRTLMIVGMGFVVVAFALILAVEDFSIALPKRYPDIFHPLLGLTAMAMLFANAIGAIFRCEPGHKKRYLFTQIHGLVGGLSFGLAIATVVIGAFMMKSLSFYTVVAWVVLHFSVELFLYMKIARSSSVTTRNTSPPQTEIIVLPESEQAAAPISMTPTVTMTVTNDEQASPQQEPLSLKGAACLFIFYMVVATMLTITSSVLLFF